MVVLVCAEERQKALLRNEARRFAPQHRQAAGTAEMEKGEHPSNRVGTGLLTHQI